jgi:hypothetical protein
LQKAKSHWARLFLPMPAFTSGNAMNNGVVKTVLDLAAHNYHTILNFKYNFSGSSFPAPGSADMQAELDKIDLVLPLVMNTVDILVIGNEPYIEKTQNNNYELNIFYETLAQHVIDYRQAHCTSPCKTHIYMGALTQKNLPANRTVSTDRWMDFVKNNPDIDGVDIHTHVGALQDVQPYLDYILPRMRPEQKFIVTEFSLVWFWGPHLDDPVASTFATKYGINSSTQNWQFIRSAIDNPVSKTEWDDFLSMSPWFENHKRFLLNAMCTFYNSNRLAVATYEFEQGQPMVDQFTGPNSTPWLLNMVFAPKTVLPNADGSNAANYWWINDYLDLQNGTQTCPAL